MGLAITDRRRRHLILAVAAAALANLGTGLGLSDGAATRAATLNEHDAGISLRVPHGWHAIAPPITSVTYPLERLLLTSYPAAAGGGCSPERAERQLPSDGALAYLFEYQGEFGSAWNQFRPSDFPPRPTHFALVGDTLGNYECWQVPSHLIRFSAAGRTFQMHVALGPRSTAARRAQLLRALDSLRFSVPPPTVATRVSAARRARRARVTAPGRGRRWLRPTVPRLG